MALKHALAPLVDLVYPPRCPACGAGIATQDGLCMACWSELVIPGKPACGACQRPFGVEEVLDGALCAACLADPPLHDGIAAGTLYNDVSRKLILAYKHGHRLALAKMLARLILARMPLLEGEWIAVPVPLHRWRLWQRGFNQSAVLARELVRGKPCQRVLIDALVRRKRTPVLGGLGKTERRQALAGAIAVNPKRKPALKGAQVILVDDVMTSGATTQASVRALKRAGAKRVLIACFARVLEEV